VNAYGGEREYDRHVAAISKKPLKQNESLRQRVEEDLIKIQDNRPLVRSFFGAKTVAYAVNL